MGDKRSLKESIEKYNQMTGENISIEDVFKLEKIKKEEEKVQVITASEGELEQLKFKVDHIIKDFIEYYAPKGRSLKATFHIIKDDKKDTYGEKVIFGDKIEIVLNIDTGKGLSVEEE